MIRGTHDDFAAGRVLPNKVIRIPDKFKGNAGSQKSPEALPRTSGEVHRKRIFRQAARPEFHHQLTGKFRPYRPVHIADVAANSVFSPFPAGALMPAADGGGRSLSAVSFSKEGSNLRPSPLPHAGWRKSQMPGLVKIYGAVYGKQIRPAYGFIQERSPRKPGFPAFPGPRSGGS